jgi:hypothetical protein
MLSLFCHTDQPLIALFPALAVEMDLVAAEFQLVCVERSPNACSRIRGRFASSLLRVSNHGSTSASAVMGASSPSSSSAGERFLNYRSRDSKSRLSLINDARRLRSSIASVVKPP